MKFYTSRLEKLAIKNVPQFAPSYSVKQVESLLRTDISQYESIDYIYLLTEVQELVGVVSIKELLNADPNQLVKEIAIKKPISASVNSMPEKAAIKAMNSGIKAIPVVDKDNKFLGIITADKVR